MKKPLGTLATRLAMLVLLATLGACGSDDDPEADSNAPSATYCTILKDAGWQVLIHDYLALGDAGDFADLRTNISELESSASAEVKAAWGVLADEYDRFTELMDDADLSIDELLYWDDNGKLPASVPRKQFNPFLRKLMALDYTKGAEAIDTITAHAKTECGMHLEVE